MKLNSSNYIFMVMLSFMAFSCVQSQEPINLQPIKVDFNISSRRAQEVNDTNYHPWPISEDNELSDTIDGVHIILKGEISSGWYKTGISAPNYARLVADGLAANGPLEMVIKGLESGQHSIMTYHNSFDDLGDSNPQTIKILVDGKEIQTVKSSNRALDIMDSAMAYTTFKVEKGKEVLIRFENVNDPSSQTMKIVLNGFEIDTPNKLQQAKNPKPENEDFHVEIDSHSSLQWELPEGAVSSFLYFGKDKNAVATAHQESPEFQKEFKDNRFLLKDLYSMNSYYWRVDSKGKDGSITRGMVWSFRPAQLAFPGAQGYGRFAIGGRGGKVIEVTNLNDDGPGSLRDAVNQDVGPRTIVFAVSGTIILKSRLVVNQPYITIAAQTAPGKGIVITRAPVGITGNDCIARFMRVRIGAGPTFDGMGLTGANHSIIDHSSISWTIDESFSSRGAHNITLQRTLISEALNVAGHTKYKKGQMHGYAATIGGDIGSFHHNLLAHNYGRNWSMGGGLSGDGYYTGRLDIRNNVVYNWGHRTTDGGAKEVNFVNNFYKPGPATDLFYALTAEHEGVGRGKQQYYFEGNVMTGYFDENNQEKGRRSKIKNDDIVNYETFLDKPFFESHVNTQSARDAYKNVLSDVGANQPMLDTYDLRIIQETLDSTFTYSGSISKYPGMIDTEADAGGFEDYPKETRASDWDSDHDGLPNWWEKEFNLNINSPSGDFSNSNDDSDKDGYTQLENYLNWMAIPHIIFKAKETFQIDAQEYFKGYTKNPIYEVTDSGCCEVYIKNGKVNVTPNSKGITAISLKVLDAEGSTMMRTFNIYAL